MSKAPKKKTAVVCSFCEKPIPPENKPHSHNGRPLCKKCDLIVASFVSDTDGWKERNG